MLRRYLKTGRWPIILATLILASLGWSSFALWAEIAARPLHTGRAISGVVYSLGVVGWAAITFYAWTAHRWVTLGRWLERLYFLLENKTLIWALVAALWVVLRVLGRLLMLTFGQMLLPPLFGMVLAVLLASILLFSLKAPHRASTAVSEENFPTVSRIAEWGAWLLPGAAALAIITYLLVATFRLLYPFELEWMEGGSVGQIGRLVAGQPLYVRPSMDFIPHIYMPLYFYLSALVAQLVGVSFVPLRLVSIVASLGCLSIIFQIVRRETTSKVDGMLAAGLFAATYPASASWLDLARADTLALCFLLAAIYALRFQRRTSGAALAGVLLALSFLTKQTMLIAALPIMLYSLIDDWRRGICAGGTAIVIAMLSCLALNVLSDGWFAYYIFGLPGQHRLYLPMLYGFWIADVWLPMGIALTLAIAYLAPVLSHFLRCSIRVISGFNTNLTEPTSAETGSRFKTELFYLAVLIGLTGCSWAGKLNDGGFNNVLLLVYAALAILFGLAVHRLRAWIDELPTGYRPVGKIAVCALCLIQFVGLAYNPLVHIPRQEDIEAGQALVETIGGVDGDVFVPFHGYLAVEAGKPSYANGVALGELAGDFGGQELDSGSVVLGEIEQAIREQRFGAVIIDSLPALDKTRLYQVILPLLDEYYQQGPSPIEDNNAFWPLTGTRSRPDIIYYPKHDE